MQVCDRSSLSLDVEKMIWAHAFEERAVAWEALGMPFTNEPHRAGAKENEPGSFSTTKVYVQRFASGQDDKKILLF